MTSGARTIALAFSVSLLATSAYTPAAFAQQLQSYVLENVRTQSKDKTAEVFIPKIEVVGSNVTRGDIERLLDPDLSAEARADLTMNMRAQRITVPEVVVVRTDKDKGRFVLRNYVVNNLDRARFDRISLGGVEGTMTTQDGADGAFTSGQMTFEGGDFSKVAAAAKAGSAADGVGKLQLFTWAGFEMRVADKDVPASAAGGNSYRFGLKSANARTDYAGDTPTRSVANIQGLYFSAPPATEAGKALAKFGYDRVELGVNFDGMYDPSTKSFSLTDYSIAGANAGALAFSGSFAEIDPTIFTANNAGRLASLMNGKVANVGLRYVDAGLFNKALAYYAASQGKSPAAVRNEWSMMIVAMLPMLMGGDPAALKLSEALSAFVSQPKSLSISLKGKGGPLGMADLMKLADPAFLLSKVEITAVANR